MKVMPLPSTSNGTVPHTPRTERQALLDQLRDANERLAANQLKDESLAVVSHELRTPLHAILGWVTLLRAGQLDPPGTNAALETVERNAKALARIVDDLLDGARVAGGTVQISPYPVDLVVVVRAAVEGLHPAAETKGVAVTFFSPPGEHHVAGDALRLQQVVENLLSNAIKFTPSGGHVEIALRRVDAETEIRVADTGRGIAADFIPRMFDRFTQADTSTTRRQGGLGLGLTIVRALVDQHGGTVSAESRGLGEGTTFIVRLPSLRARLRREAHPLAGLLEGVRIVLFEDDADARQALALLLEVAGATVMAAASVGSALSAIDACQPDVIVSDIGLPDEDGYALLARVRARGDERGGRTPAIALTGYARPQDQARILAAGFHMHLRKPVDPDVLVSAVVATIKQCGAGPA